MSNFVKYGKANSDRKVLPCILGGALNATTVVFKSLKKSLKIIEKSCPTSKFHCKKYLSNFDIACGFSSKARDIELVLLHSVGFSSK